MSSQPIINRTRPNLDGLVHPQVAEAIRIHGDQIVDVQQAIAQLVSQLIGGGTAICTVVNGIISAQITNGGYYQTAPKVKLVTNGQGYSATVNLVGNRIGSVTIVQGTGATQATLTFTP